MKSLIRSKGFDKKTQEIVNMEIKKQVIESAERQADHFDAFVLYSLHKVFGFGKKRLRRFYEEYDKAVDELCKHYASTMANQEGRNDTEFYMITELKKIGVDVEFWREQKSNWSAENDEVWQKG